MARNMRTGRIATAFHAEPGVNKLLRRLLFAALAVLLLS